MHIGYTRTSALVLCKINRERLADDADYYEQKHKKERRCYEAPQARRHGTLRHCYYAGYDTVKKWADIGYKQGVIKYAHKLCAVYAVQLKEALEIQIFSSI